MKGSYENIKTMTDALVGTKVQILVSDPWDFATEVLVESIIAVIEHVLIRIDAKTVEFHEHESVLLRVLEPFAYKKLKFEYLLASPRHFGNGLQELSRGENIPFNFLRIPELEAKPDDPFQAERDWRGGPEGLIGTLKMK